ncbi:hypothetical protein EDP1_4202 [Pseudomonas putida S610]|nr:hypothetical protein EDP1_4202 [Pseudomonas putida S610]
MGYVTRGISGSGLQHFAVYLSRVQGDAEHASGADDRRAQLGAVSSQNTHSAARLGAARDHGAVGVHCQLCRGGGRRDIRGGDLGGQ